MACPAILTGDQFITRVMGHIDCQAAYLGSYGWQELGRPGSMAATVMTGILTLFVALFGIRMLFGPAPGIRDVVGDVLKIGIALTMAFSWPAFRTVIHDVVIDGPAELAASAGAPVMPEGAGLVARMQQVDNGILQVVEEGTGRQGGAYLEQENPGATFGSQALEDENSLGMGRLFFIAGLLASFGLMRIIAGLLLALAPIAAGMLLFEATRGLFSGWLRGLVLSLIGGAAISVVTAGELAILEPWLADVMRLRQLGYATPSAPTELLALTLGFAVIKLGSIWLMARIAFNRGWISLPTMPDFKSVADELKPSMQKQVAPALSQTRVAAIGDGIEMQLRREETTSVDRGDHRSLSSEREATNSGTPVDPDQTIRRRAKLGSSWRHTAPRSSIAATRRDTT